MLRKSLLLSKWEICDCCNKVLQSSFSPVFQTCLLACSITDHMTINITMEIIKVDFIWIDFEAVFWQWCKLWGHLTFLSCNRARSLFKHRNTLSRRDVRAPLYMTEWLHHSWGLTLHCWWLCKAQISGLYTTHLHPGVNLSHRLTELNSQKLVKDNLTRWHAMKRDR